MSRTRSLRIFAAAALCLSIAAAAQTPLQLPGPSPNLAGIAHVALRVADLDASLAFYQKLGFIKAFDLSRDGKVYEAFIKINDRQFLELYPTSEKDPQIGFLHVCFEGKDLQSVHDYYVVQGLKPKDVRTAGAGNLLFTMTGPDTPTGPQNMEYTQYLPGSLHSKDFGQHLGPDRISTRLISVAIAFLNPAAASAFYADKTSFVPVATRPPAQPRTQPRTQPTPGLAALYEIPGAPTESIRIETPFLGQHARLTFAADPTVAATALKQAGLAFLAGSPYSKTDITLADPDGNQLILHARETP